MTSNVGAKNITDKQKKLGFSAEEKALMDMQIAAERAVEREMRAKHVSQAELARRMGTQQPAVSRMIRQSGSASFETLFRALLALGATPRKIASVLA